MGFHQSKVLLHFFGYESKAGGGGGVHCKYADKDSIAKITLNNLVGSRVTYVSYLR